MHRVLGGRCHVVVNDAERVVARLHAWMRSFIVLLEVDLFQHRAAHACRLGVADDKSSNIIIRNVTKSTANVILCYCVFRLSTP